MPAPASVEVPVDAPNHTQAPEGWVAPVVVEEEPAPAPVEETPVVVTEEPVPAPAPAEVPVDAPNHTQAPEGWAAPVVEEEPAPAPASVPMPVPAPVVQPAKPKKKHGASFALCWVFAVLAVLLALGAVGEALYFGNRLKGSGGELETLRQENAALQVTVEEQAAEIQALTDEVDDLNEIVEKQAKTIESQEKTIKALEKQLVTTTGTVLTEEEKALLERLRNMYFFCEADGGMYYHTWNCHWVQESSDYFAFTAQSEELEELLPCPECHPGDE